MIAIAEVKPSMKNELKKETDVAKNAFRVLSDYRPTSVSFDNDFDSKKIAIKKVLNEE